MSPTAESANNGKHCVSVASFPTVMLDGVPAAAAGVNFNSPVVLSYEIDPSPDGVPSDPTEIAPRARLVVKY